MNEGNIKDIVFEECNVNNVNDEDISTYGGIFCGISSCGSYYLILSCIILGVNAVVR